MSLILVKDRTVILLGGLGEEVHLTIFVGKFRRPLSGFLFVVSFLGHKFFYMIKPSSPLRHPKLCSGEERRGEGRVVPPLKGGLSMTTLCPEERRVVSPGGRSLLILPSQEVGRGSRDNDSDRVYLRQLSTPDGGDGR